MSSETDEHVYGQLFGAGRATPDRPCLVTEDRILSYGDLDRRAGQFAAALGVLDVEVGDRLVVQVDKSADAVALYLACLRAGVVYVPLNTAYTAAEVRFFLDDADAARFVARPGTTAPPGVAVETLGDDGSGSLAVLADAQGDAPPPVIRRGDHWAAMLYTSGTTGRSKGAMLSCSNLVANARALHDAWHFAPDDVLLHILPVFHVHGLFVALHCAFLSGATVRFHHRFDTDAVLADLPRATVLMGVPTHLHRLLARPGFDRDVCASMRLFTSGSAPLPAADHDAFAARTGHRIVERYGMTETMILASNPYRPKEGRVAGTVGFPLPGVDLRVVDDDGGPVEPGTIGTVEVRSDGVFLGYWNLPDTTAGSFRDGWFVTGDLGSLDDDGRLTLAGRRTDLIITGGLNVYPKEVEAVLEAVPGVDEAAVIGVHDDDFGEQVVAIVVAAESTDPSGPDEPALEAALRSACDGHLARFKHPRRYEIVDALPRNAMGKIQKAVLRDRLAD